MRKSNKNSMKEAITLKNSPIIEIPDPYKVIKCNKRPKKVKKVFKMFLNFLLEINSFTLFIFLLVFCSFRTRKIIQKLFFLPEAKS